ncbi:hypothetical protein AAVH_22225 [Aphelenchoides avenae]|nr:hypothetical protein AAVH_22225 [Aphelenchus avenae]
MAQQVVSIRNRSKIADNGYAYVFDKRSADGTLQFYRCDKKMDDCAARIHVSIETCDVVRRFHDHNHGSDAARIEAARVVAAVKRRRAENQELSGQLVATALQKPASKCQRSGNGKTAYFRAMKQAINRERNKIGAMPANPLNLQDFVMPEQYK